VNEEWNTYVLADLIQIKHGFAFKGRNFCDEVTQDVIVTPGNFMIGGGFKVDNLKYYRGPVPKDYILQPHDLIVTMTDLSKSGDTLGYPALVPESSVRYLHNQRIGLVKINDPKLLDKGFLFYLLRGADYRHHVLATASGSTVRHTSPNRIQEFRTTLPPLPEQRAITGVLGALDDKIKLNRRTSRTLEQVGRAIFHAWFMDFKPVKAKAAGARSFPSMPQEAFDALPIRLVESELGLIPEGWGVKALSSICTLVSGGTPKRSEPSYWNGDDNVPWYSIRDAPSDGMVWVLDTDECITRKGLENSAAQLVPKGCTIISARGTVGKLAMAGRPMAFNQSCYGLLPRDGSFFFYLYLLTRTLVSDLQQRTHGSVFETITRSTFDGLLVTTPPDYLVSSFDAVVAPVFDKLLASLHESTKLATLRDYLLPKLLSGEVLVEVHNV